MTQQQYGYAPQGDPYQQQYAQPQYQQQPPPQYGPPAQQGYGQPQYGNQAPQGYGQQQGPQGPPAQPLVQGTLEDFYNQRSAAGGQGLKFTDDRTNQPMIGKRYRVRIARPLVNGDVQQQTDKFGNGLTHRDGSPKLVLVIPVQLVVPDPLFPDGEAVWYVKGQARDELTRAMMESGETESLPQMNAIVDVELARLKPSGKGMNPAHVFAIQYTPAGAVQDYTAQGAPQQYAPQPAYGDPGQQLQQAPQGQQQQLPVQYAQQPAPQGYGQPQGQPQYQQAPAAQGQVNYGQAGYEAAPVQQPPVQGQMQQTPAPQGQMQQPYQVPNGQAAMQQAVNQFPQGQPQQPAQPQGAQYGSPGSGGPNPQQPPLQPAPGGNYPAGMPAEAQALVQQLVQRQQGQQG